MITLFFPMNQPTKVGENMKEEGSEPIRVRINYFEPLSSILEKFNNHYNKTGIEVAKLYNKFGQEIPLTYRVQKTNLDVYFLSSNES
jgi:hypothetical protein